ncbi:hypothetical protein Trydic_g3284 [Trypoxylus dichotomus]
MKTETEFRSCKEALRKIFINMGYWYKKSESNAECLMERQNIVAWRAQYLRFMNHNDSLSRNRRAVVYLDESYVHTNYTVPKCWQILEEKGGLKNDGTVQRWII